MILIFLVILLLLSNWFFADAFVFLPLKLLDYLSSWSSWSLLIGGLILLGWFFRD